MNQPPSPDGPDVTPTDHDRDPSDIEVVIPLERVEGSGYVPSQPSPASVDERIRIVATPEAYLVEFGLSHVETTEYHNQYLSPAEARGLAHKIRFNETEVADLFEQERALDVTYYLDFAATVAISQAISELVDAETFEAAAKHEISPEEFRERAIANSGIAPEDLGDGTRPAAVQDSIE